MLKKKKFDFLSKYEDLKDEKAERRYKKRIKKMPVHSSGLYEIWKIKMERSKKE